MTSTVLPVAIGNLLSFSSRFSTPILLQLMSTIGIVTSFTSNVWAYTTFLKFLIWFTQVTIGIDALGQISIMGLFLFEFGFISLPGNCVRD